MSFISLFLFSGILLFMKSEVHIFSFHSSVQIFRAHLLFPSPHHAPILLTVLTFKHETQSALYKESVHTAL